jgi:hypothetical protein
LLLPQYKAHQPFKDLNINERMKIEVWGRDMLLQLMVQNAIGRENLAVISEISDICESF